MKLIIPLFCTLAANAAVLKDSTLGTKLILLYDLAKILVAKRQLFGGLFGSTNSPIFLYPANRIAKKTPLKPVISQAKAESFTQATRKRLIFGPFQLQGVGVRTH
jgi:hypothetical protein